MSPMDSPQQTASKDPRSLERIQKWMQAVVMHPGGVAKGIASPAAQDQIAIDPGELDDVVRSSRRLTSGQRLEIYNRAYYARLLDCLAEQFPVLVHTVGEETFSQFALAYLQAYPSRSYTLHRLAADFARHLIETRPGGDQPGFQDARWPELLIDIAQLEWNIHEVFDGPGTEGQSLLTRDDLERIPRERWPDVQVVPVPCLRVLQLRFPLNGYFTAVRKGSEAALPEPAESFMAILRRDYRVRRHDLTRPQYTLLKALLAGAKLADSVEQTAETCGPEIEPDSLARDLQNWFYQWTVAGFFESVRLAEC